MAAGWSTAVRAAAPANPKRSKRQLVEALTGVHNFMVTTFHSNYELDADGLRRNIADHARNATKNMTIVICGGLGELFTISVEEQKALVEAAVAGAKGKLPVVAGVGGSYKNAIMMAQNAERAGADAVLIFAYPLACRDSDGQYQYLHDVARAVDIGVVAYPCGENGVRIETLKRLAKLPNMVGFKDSSGSVEVGQALGSLVGEGLLWIAEGESHAETIFPVGGRAYTTAVATFVPEACRRFWQAGVSGDLARMKHIRESRIDPVVKLRSVKPGYGISGIKVALEALGRAGGPVRPPGTQVEQHDRAKIAEIALKYAEKSIRNER